MKKEFNLSEKINPDGFSMVTKDVKEFIKRGEEIIKRPITITEKILEFRKLAGDKLNG